MFLGGGGRNNFPPPFCWFSSTDSVMDFFEENPCEYAYTHMTDPSSICPEIYTTIGAYEIETGLFFLYLAVYELTGLGSFHTCGFSQPPRLWIFASQSDKSTELF